MNGWFVEEGSENEADEELDEVEGSVRELVSAPAPVLVNIRDLSRV